MADIDDDLVMLGRDGPVAILTLNRPLRRNAFALAMRQALLERLTTLSDPDDPCRAIVLTGAGSHFCAGGDISEMKPGGALHIRRRMGLLLDIVRALVAGPRPVVVAVEGCAMGAGLALAAACDHVVAADSARFATAFLKVGVNPDTGIVWSLAQKVGAGRARDLILQAEEFDGRKAADLGLANTVVATGTALTAALASAHILARLPPVAVALLKAALAGGCETLEQTFETEINLQPILRASADHLEAVQAFLEKRRPVFTGY